MIARVTNDFYDLTTGLGNVPENTYRAGSLFEGTEERVAELIGKGFCEPLEPEPELDSEPEPEPEDEPEKKPVKKKKSPKKSE